MILRTVVACLIALTFSLGSAADSSNKVLVLVESLENSSTFVQYLERIKEQGYEIEQRSATDPKLHLREWDTWKYTKLIIFASGIKSTSCTFSHRLGPQKKVSVARACLITNGSSI